jgi:hypothetical protein
VEYFQYPAITCTSVALQVERYCVTEMYTNIWHGTLKESARLEDKGVDVNWGRGHGATIPLQ